MSWNYYSINIVYPDLLFDSVSSITSFVSIFKVIVRVEMIASVHHPVQNARRRLLR